MLTPSAIYEACTSVGVAKYGRSIGLDEKIKVDLIVIGSVAVDPKTGARLGKGEVITNYLLLYNLALLLLERVKNVRLKQDSRILMLQIMHTSCMVGMEVPRPEFDIPVLLCWVLIRKCSWLWACFIKYYFSHCLMI